MEKGELRPEVVVDCELREGDAMIVQVRRDSFTDNLFERYKLMSNNNQDCHDTKLNNDVFEMHNNNISPMEAMAKVTSI